MNPTAAGSPVQAPRSTVRYQGVQGYTTRIYPAVYGGICEKCGVLDQNRDSQDQYKLCEHYRGLTLECNYCDPTKDQREVTRISKLKIFDHPTRRDELGRPLLACVCDCYTCQDKFQSEYK